MEFKEKIKQLRKQKGLSQIQLADGAGINQASYSNIESGITERDIIKIGVAEKIAKTLDIPFSELFEIEVPNNSDVEKLTLEIEQFKNTIAIQNDSISLLREQNEILKPFRLAFIQERTISELMIQATLEIVKEQHEKGEVFELTSFEVRKRAISIYQNNYPDIQLNPYLNLTPGEMPKQ